jgi:hypothetical protein
MAREGGQGNDHSQELECSPSLFQGSGVQRSGYFLQPHPEFDIDPQRPPISYSGVVMGVSQLGLRWEPEQI